MIVFLATSAHLYTHALAVKALGRRFRTASYSSVLREPTLPVATYIFSDLDRLGPWELELAARLYRMLEAEGLRVLNDPARVRQRADLLAGLFRRGHNSFNAVGVDEPPPAYPVFLRSISAHRGPLSDLIHDAQGLAIAIADALSKGVPRKELLVVEYRAEPLASGVFRKLSMHKVGETLVPAICVHDTGWMAKNGTLGAASADDYSDELDLIRSHRFAERLRPIFEFAEISYGRADFALVAGRIETYEVNTNPMLARFDSHPDPRRVQSSTLEIEGLLKAFGTIDTARSPHRIRVQDSVLVRQRRHDRGVRRDRWRI